MIKTSHLIRSRSGPVSYTPRNNLWCFLLLLYTTSLLSPSFFLKFGITGTRACCPVSSSLTALATACGHWTNRFLFCGKSLYIEQIQSRWVLMGVGLDRPAHSRSFIGNSIIWMARKWAISNVIVGVNECLEVQTIYLDNAQVDRDESEVSWGFSDGSLT